MGSAGCNPGGTGANISPQPERLPSAVKQYIANWRERHHKVTFQEELRALLDRNGIVYYEWDLWV